MPWGQQGSGTFKRGEQRLGDTKSHTKPDLRLLEQPADAQRCRACHGPFGAPSDALISHTLMLRTKTEFTLTATSHLSLYFNRNIYLAICFFHVNRMDFHCLNIAKITKSHLQEGFVWKQEVGQTWSKTCWSVLTSPALHNWLRAGGDGAHGQTDSSTHAQVTPRDSTLTLFQQQNTSGQLKSPLSTL